LVDRIDRKRSSHINDHVAFYLPATAVAALTTTQIANEHHGSSTPCRPSQIAALTTEPARAITTTEIANLSFVLGQNSRPPRSVETWTTTQLNALQTFTTPQYSDRFISLAGGSLSRIGWAVLLVSQEDRPHPDQVARQTTNALTP